MIAAFNAGGVISYGILATCLSIEEGAKLETEWTDKFRAEGHSVFNRRHDARSNKGLPHTEKTKRRIRTSLSGRSTRSREAISAAAEKLRGVPKPANVIAASQEGLKRWRSNPENVAAVAKKIAKLTAREVRIIRQSDKPYSELGKQYGVSPAIICRIRQGKAYRWVK